MGVVMLLKSMNTENGFDIRKYIRSQEQCGGCVTRLQLQGLTIIPPRYPYESTNHSYLHRVFRIWNSLPLNIRQLLILLNNSHQIRNALLPFYIKRFNEYYDAEITCTWALKCPCARWNKYNKYVYITCLNMNP